MKAVRPYPVARITHKAARSLKAGHPWVYAGEVTALEPSPATGEPATNGCVVDLVEDNGTWQGAALLSLESTIRARVVTRNANDRMDEAFWRRRIEYAWHHRVVAMGSRGLAGESDLEACRVAFSEADGLPGLTVDRYGQVLVAQVGTFGMELLRETVYPLLVDVLRTDGQDVRWIYERCDSPVRAKEGLPLRKGWWNVDEPGPALVTVRENALSYHLDLENSQKTGYFLDQKYNRRAVRELASGRRVLDCFCHVGPFGLNAAAGGARFVRCVDASQAALDLAEKNARLNGLDDRMAFTREDIVEWLPGLARDKAAQRELGGPFDLVVLDPPAFTKSRSNVRGAMRGYREINAAGMRLLPRGGYLATCSCSHFMARDLLAQAIAEAAHEANVQLRQVEERQQAPDHPILWGFPESHYLDFFVFQVV